MNLVLALGSNIGNRAALISSAVADLSKSFRFLSSSSLYETEPLPADGTDIGGMYLNSCAVFETDIHPSRVVATIQNIEKNLGRESRPKWSEREIDIDIIFYGNIIFRNELVSIPHMEMHKRRFVLEPLSKIAPNYVHPVLLQNITSLLSAL